MNLYYRIAVISGALLIYSGLILRKIVQFHIQGRRDESESEKSARVRSFIIEMFRTYADYLILVLLFITPLHEIFIFQPKESYAGFIAGFSTMIITSLAVSLFIDRALRQTFYRQHNTDMNSRLNDLTRDAVNSLFIALGVLIADFCTYLSAKAGASIPLQVILPVTAVLFYLGAFRILFYFRIRRHRTSDTKPKMFRIQEWLFPWLIRTVQVATALLFWKRLKGFRTISPAGFALQR